MNKPRILLAKIKFLNFFFPLFFHYIVLNRSYLNAILRLINNELLLLLSQTFKRFF